MMMRRIFVSLSFLMIFMVSVQAGTLDVVKQRGHVTCGVSQGLPGFSNPDDAGQWQGLDADVCRAIAAAIFGDPGKAKFLPLSAKVRFTALQSGEIDVLTRNTTWSMQRDSTLGVDFAVISFLTGRDSWSAKIWV